MKTVVISGGSSGIGLETVKKFLDSRYQVYNLDLTEGTLQHPLLKYILCNVAEVSALQSAADVISTQVSSIDALIANAGIHFSKNILSITEEDFAHVFGINIKGSIFLTKSFLPLLLNNKKGSIVYIGSDQSLIGKKNSALYGSSKSALVNLTKSIALDFAEKGIRSNLVAAGTIDTPLYRAAIKRHRDRSGMALESIHQEEERLQPVGRLGFSHEVASLIYFLCSDESQFITGAVIPIDGGYTAA